MRVCVFRQSCVRLTRKFRHTLHIVKDTRLHFIYPYRLEIVRRRTGDLQSALECQLETSGLYELTFALNVA